MGTKYFPGSLSVPESLGGDAIGKCQKSLREGVVLKEKTVSLTFQRKNPSREQSQAPG